jgi:acyl-CoA thioesterase-1
MKFNRFPSNRHWPPTLLFFLLSFLPLLACNSAEPDVVHDSHPANIKRMQARTTGPIHYVALGDSTGVGVGATNGGYVARLFKRIQAARPGSELTNLCASGATTENVISGQLDRAIAAKPTLLTLGIGINDIGHGVSPDQFSRNFEQIVSRLTNETSASLVITNIPDISTAPTVPLIMRQEIARVITLCNARIADTASRHGAIVVDAYTTTHELLPSHPEYFSRDGFHPSDAGYEVWAEQIWPAMAKAAGIS